MSDPTNPTGGQSHGNPEVHGSRAPENAPLKPEQVDAQKNLAKLGSKAGLEELDKKIEKGQVEDKETRDLIAGLNVMDEDIDSPENIQRSKALMSVLGVLMHVAALNKLDYSSPEALVWGFTMPKNPALKLTGNEMLAMTKLNEIQKRPDSKWSTTLTNEWWPIVKSHAEKNVPTKPEMGAQAAPAAAPLAALSGQVEGQKESEGFLTKALNFASDHPIGAAIVTGIAIAGAVKAYKMISGLFPDSGEKAPEKDGKSGWGIAKWLLGGGLGATLLTFATGRTLGAEAVQKFFKEKGWNIAESDMAQFMIHLSHGEFKKAFESIKDAVMGKDEFKEDDKHIAEVINKAMSTNKVKSDTIHALRSKKYKEFMEDGFGDSIEWIRDAKESALEGLADMLGPVGGLLGFDSHEEREALVAIKGYFKSQEARINETAFNLDDDTTLGDVFGKLIPKMGPAPVAPATPGSPASPGVAAVEGAAVAGAVAAAAAPKAPVAPAPAAADATVGTIVDTGSEGPTNEQILAKADTLETKLTELAGKTADNQKSRKDALEKHNNNILLKEHLVTNERVLKESLTTNQIIEGARNLTKRRYALAKKRIKADTEEQKQLDAKINEINGYLAHLVDLVAAHENAAQAYLTAMHGNDIQEIQRTFSELTIAKEPIVEIFEDAFERDGWAFAESMLVAQGLNGWNVYKHVFRVGNLKEEHASYLFGKYKNKVLSIVRGPRSALAESLKKDPLMSFEDVVKNTDELHGKIDVFADETKRGIKDLTREEFFTHYEQLEKEGQRLQSQLDRHLAEHKKAFNEAVRKNDRLGAQKAAEKMTEVSAARAKLEAGIVEDATYGYKLLKSGKRVNKSAKGVIGQGEALLSGWRGTGADEGLNQLRNVMRTVIRKDAEAHGGVVKNLAKHLLPSKGRLAFFGAQLVVGGTVLRDDQTSFMEGLKQTAMLTAPVVGTYHDFKQAITGEESFTGRHLDAMDRIISTGFGIAGAASDVLTIFGIGMLGEELVTAGRSMRGLSAARKAQQTIEAGRELKGAAGLVKEESKIREFLKYARTTNEIGNMYTLGFVGASAVTLGFNKLSEIVLPDGFEKDVMGPLSYQYQKIEHTIDTKVEHMAEHAAAA